MPYQTMRRHCDARLPLQPRGDEGNRQHMRPHQMPRVPTGRCHHRTDVRLSRGGGRRPHEQRIALRSASAIGHRHPPSAHLRSCGDGTATRLWRSASNHPPCDCASGELNLHQPSCGVGHVCHRLVHCYPQCVCRGREGTGGAPLLLTCGKQRWNAVDWDGDCWLGRLQTALSRC